MKYVRFGLKTRKYAKSGKRKTCPPSKSLEFGKPAADAPGGGRGPLSGLPERLCGCG